MAALPIIWMTTQVHDGVDKYAIIFNTKVYAEWKPINEMTAHIFLNNLPCFRGRDDILNSCFYGLDERFG